MTDRSIQIFVARTDLILCALLRFAVAALCVGYIDFGAGNIS